MARVYVGLGSNIEPLRHLRSALVALQHLYGTLILSSVYESQAVGFVGDNFYNLVVGFDTEKDVYVVSESLRQIEDDCGRKRTEKSFDSRTLDLDLLLYDNLVLQNGRLKLPRHEILSYAFVLCPLAEIAPHTQHPLTGQTYAELWHNFDKNQQSLWPVAVDLCA